MRLLSRRCAAGFVWLAFETCLAQTAAEWDSPRVNQIAQKLRCPCGCNLQMSCQMPPHPCPTCKRNRIRIYHMLSSGRSEEEILASYVNEDGPEVMWVTPGKAGRAAPYGVGAGGCAVVLAAIVRLLRKPRPQATLDQGALNQAAKEMEELDRW